MDSQPASQPAIESKPIPRPYLPHPGAGGFAGDEVLQEDMHIFEVAVQGDCGADCALQMIYSICRGR
jgi:hypothetical protein